MNITYESRTIRIFISSTFEDMKEERDYLITKIFPKLAAEAAKRDVTLIPLDLRWGISEEESRTGKVIEICLQEIEQSRPFFIGLLGNRYGWCPPKEELQKNTALQERYNWVETDISEGLSVTEMEIQYGALRNPEKIDAFFYIRNDGQAEGENAEKLKRLKNEVRNNRRYPVSEYRTVEELGSEVEAAFTQLLDERFPNCPLTNLEKERLAQLAFLHNRCEAYIPQEEALAVLDNFLKDDNAHNLVVTGESGMGKSALIANWLAPLIRKDGLKVIYHFVGNGEAEGNYQHIVQRISEEIRDSYHLPQDDNWGMDKKKPEEALQSLYGMIAGKEPLLLVLDGINQLADEDNAKQLLWLPQATRNIKYLFSTLPDDKTMAVFTNRKYPIFTLQPLHKAQQRELVNLYLRRYGKKLTQEQVDRIIHNPQNKNTLVLRTLLDELIGFGSYEQLDKRIDYYLKSDSIEDFFQRVLQRFEEDFTEPQVRHLLSLIAFSRNGLSEQEIMDIAGITPYHWSQFYCALRSYITSQNGFLIFSHTYIKDAVVERYIKEWDNAKQEIIQFFENKQYTERTYNELSYQYNLLQQYEKLYKLLLNFKATIFLYQKNEYELIDYWNNLLAQGLQFSPRAYFGVQGDKIERAECYACLGDLFSRSIVDLSLAYDLLNKELSIYKAAINNKNITQEIHDNYLTKIIICRYALGKIDENQGKYESAIEIYKGCLDLEKQLFGKEHQGTGGYYNAIGCCYALLEKYDLAQEAFNQALTISKKTIGEDRQQVANCYGNLGVIYKATEQYDLALKYFKQALGIYKALFGEENPLIANSYNNIGTIYNNQKEYDKALEYLKKSCDIYLLFYQEKHPQIAINYNNIGYVYQCKAEGQGVGDCRFYENAIEYYQMSLQIDKSIFGKKHANVARRYYNIGCAYYKWGKDKKAGIKKLSEIESYLGFTSKFSLFFDFKGFQLKKLFIKALKYGKKALGIFLQTLGEEHPATKDAELLIQLCKKQLKRPAG